MENQRMKSTRNFGFVADQTKDSVSDFPDDTADFAALNGVKEQSVRARYCRFGSYFGITPRKLKNGRLMWPHTQVEA
jgi:hypothetical protein